MTTKADILKKVSKDTGVKISDTKKIFELLIGLVTEKSKNQQVKISGFGTFTYNTTPKRIGRNPKSKESYIISSRKKLNFKSSNKVKGILN